MEYLETAGNLTLNRLAAGLGASIWVETHEALVFGRHSTAALLVHWASAGNWWEATRQQLELPEPVECAGCGHRAYQGKATSRIVAPGVGPVVVSLLLLGHNHAGAVGQEAARSIYLVESIKLARDHIEPQLLAESSVRFAPTLAPSSAHEIDGEGDDACNELDAYLGSMGHKLRTQLASLLGYSELLLEEGFGTDSFGRDSLERIERSGREVLDIVDALEVHLMRQQAKRRLAQTLQKVSMMMASSLNLNEVIPKIHESIAQLVSFDRSQLWWVYDGYLELAEASPDAPTRVSVDEEPYRRVFQELPNIQYIPKIDREHMCDAPHCLGPEDRSWVCLPLMGEKRALALITLASESAHAYSDQDLDLLTAFGHHASLALCNARQYSESRRLSDYDPLTQALSRRYFFESAQNKLDAARRGGEPLSLMMFDVDHFKQVNDTYGHGVGDVALKHVVDNCQLALRPLDLVGRYGGEEFVVLLPGVELAIAMEIADRVRRRIGLSEVESEGRRFRITISAGVATFHPEMDTKIEELINRADAALYRAKEGGRDQMCAEEWDPVTVRMILE
ncbi:sensor domain-containing diguanylate cyclase [Bradymonas sediminis]|uniref:Uncharacterized protein n=1 Tax=Bradymonas sediminis TaxID=1548548 RepID=A0A2Z4FGU4_9DELT|nr:diguanylate cyclase [Bradymonas sediminis]AWV88120.1 hypothetical protein DN745_01725 [Bradymonas sediminis]TDP77243.1 diguanylate cyclase (GGDEF)-like protein [Bradymonas sediminis]